MRFTPETPALPSPRPLLTALLVASFLTTSGSAQPVPNLAAARAAAERTEALWRQARGLDALHDGRVPASITRAAAASPDDIHWQNRYGVPVPDGSIWALLTYGDRLIVGGAFNRIGDLVVPGIAAWDGTAWSELPGFPGGNVKRIAPYGAGFVVLATSANGPGVWQWDGAAWHALAFPTAWDAGGMTVLDDRIAVSYTYPSNEWRSRVALYGPGGWTELPGDFDGGVYALAWYAGELYAGGLFSQAGGAPAPLVARWDGAAWQAVAPDLLPDPNSVVWDMAVAAGELVACGTFGLNNATGQIHDIARWNGTRWASLDWVSTGAYLGRLRTLGTDLYAVGTIPDGPRSHGIARWDGAAWHLDEDHLRSGVSDLAQFGGDLYAGGSLFADDPRPTTPLARRQNGVWEPSILPATGMNGLFSGNSNAVYDIVTMNGQVIACGDFQVAARGGSWRRCATTARWDGIEWAQLGMESWVYAVTHNLVVHNGYLYFVGFFAPDDIWHAGTVMRLIGNRWEIVRPFLGTSTPVCAASALGELIIGGAARGDPFHGIAGWDGMTWHPIGGGVSGDESAVNSSFVEAVAQHGDDLIAAGRFSEMGGVPCANIAAWNPATGWRPLGSGLDRDGVSLLSRNGVLYVAGYFKTAGGIPVPGIAQWLNGKWSALPPPPGIPSSYPQVHSLGWYRGQLAVSGFGLAGNVAILDAKGTWHPLGSGLDGPATVMVENGPSLYLGGFFSAAGGKPAYGFAEWRDESVEPPARPPDPQVTAAPNPFATDVHLRYELPAVAFARVEIFDLAGHRVDRVFEGYQGAGPQDVVWSPLRSRARPGVYFAQLVIDGKSRTVSVVRIP